MNKTHLRQFAWITAACWLLLALVLAFAATKAHAQTTAADVTPAATATMPAAPAFYVSSEFWSALFGIVAGIVAIWRNNAANTHQKINESLILGIEQATKIPQVADYESHIKQTIRAQAEKYGVQPLLHRLVTDLTEPDPEFAAANQS